MPDVWILQVPGQGRNDLFLHEQLGGVAGLGNHVRGFLVQLYSRFLECRDSLFLGLESGGDGHSWIHLPFVGIIPLACFNGNAVGFVRVFVNEGRICGNGFAGFRDARRVPNGKDTQISDAALGKEQNFSFIEGMERNGPFGRFPCFGQ